MSRCRYCNEVQFKESHKEKDCAMKEYDSSGDKNV